MHFFAVISLFGELVPKFLFSVKLSSISNGEWQFLVPIGCITLDRFFFQGSLLPLDIPGFAGISSCRKYNFRLYYILVSAFTIIFAGWS